MTQTAAAIPDAPPLSQCPQCEYSLRGLPARHRCPECGFEYDEFTRVWKPRRPWSTYLMAAFPLYILMLSFSNFRFQFGRTGAWGIVFSILAAITIVVVARRMWRASEANARGRFAAIAPAGLMIRTEGEVVTLPWRNLVKARHRWWLSRLFIEIDDPALSCRVRPMFEVNLLGNTIHEIVRERDRKAFARAVNEAIQRHRDAVATVGV